MKFGCVCSATVHLFTRMKPTNPQINNNQTNNKTITTFFFKLLLFVCDFDALVEIAFNKLSYELMALCNISARVCVCANKMFKWAKNGFRLRTSNFESRATVYLKSKRKQQQQQWHRKNKNLQNTVVFVDTRFYCFVCLIRKIRVCVRACVRYAAASFLTDVVVLRIFAVVAFLRRFYLSHTSIWARPKMMKWKLAKFLRLDRINDSVSDIIKKIQ